MTMVCIAKIWLKTYHFRHRYNATSGQSRFSGLPEGGVETRVTKSIWDGIPSIHLMRYATRLTWPQFASMQRIAGSRFLRAVATLSSGQSLAAITSIAAAPILGRLYQPAEYGVLGGYMAVSSVLTGIGNWQYSQAIIVENRENKAHALVRLCVITTLVTALFSALVGAAIFLYPASSFQAERSWFLLLPVTTMTGGLTAAWTAMANRRRRYRSMAAAQVASVFITVCGSIAFGFAGFGYVGPIVAYLMGAVVSCLFYAHIYYTLPDCRKYALTRRRLVAMAAKHRGFALFSTPSSFVGNFAMQVPVYALGLQGATGMIGLFSRARQLLSMPITLVGGSIAQVFQQRAAVDYATTGNCERIFRSTFWMLLGIGLLPTLLMAIAAPWLFEVFLGPHWRPAGEVARVLAPMLLLRLVCSPLATVFAITGAQREDFVLSVVTTFVTAVAVAVPLLLNWPSIWIAIGFSGSYCLTYCIYLWRGYQHCKC
ncbi:MAG TPA: hypothetical protein EYG03_08000 [Planctomycetes bacterium]|nr:hypothetical protein [Planctomycetota bacterium]